MAFCLTTKSQTNDLVFTNITYTSSFNVANMTLNSDQMNGIIQMIQSSGIVPSIPVNSTNMFSLLLMKSNVDTNLFTLNIRLK